jgi:hypothetical protein
MAGLVRARMGTDLPKAITLLRKASSAEPTNVVFRNTLARYQTQTGA